MLELRLHQNPKKHVYTRISNSVRKASYLFALFGTHPLYLKHKQKLGGVLDMVDGLEYHMRKIRIYEKKACLAASEIRKLMQKTGPLTLPRLTKKTNHHPAVHEAVAYIGRLGQLDYFFESDWFGESLDKKQIALTIPSILALMPLRNKHSAHRQQDDPRPGDCGSLGLNEFGLRHGLASRTLDSEQVHFQYSFPTLKREPLLEKYHPSPVDEIEFFGSNNIVNFAPTQVHGRIMNETMRLLEQFFGFSP